MKKLMSTFHKTSQTNQWNVWTNQCIFFFTKWYKNFNYFYIKKFQAFPKNDETKQSLFFLTTQKSWQ